MNFYIYGAVPKRLVLRLDNFKLPKFNIYPGTAVIIGSDIKHYERGPYH